jgi:hypothetical protein
VTLHAAGVLYSQFAETHGVNLLDFAVRFPHIVVASLASSLEYSAELVKESKNGR